MHNFSQFSGRKWIQINVMYPDRSLQCLSDKSLRLRQIATWPHNHRLEMYNFCRRLQIWFRAMSQLHHKESNTKFQKCINWNEILYRMFCSYCQIKRSKDWPQVIFVSTGEFSCEKFVNKTSSDSLISSQFHQTQFLSPHNNKLGKHGKLDEPWLWNECAGFKI